MLHSSSAPSDSPVAYTSQAQKRAERAAKCSPFRLKLFHTLNTQSVALGELTDTYGIRNGYTRLPVSELAAEDELMWLLSVGLLRREVDGQGLTDSFRLTPLGKLLLNRWLNAGLADIEPGFQDHLYNSMSRWLRLPGWIQG